MDVHIWQFFLDRLAEPDIQIAFHLGRQPSLDADFRGAVVPGFLGPPDDLFHRQ